MERFPDEFEGLLNARGRRMLSRYSEPLERYPKSRTPIVVLRDLIDDRAVRDSIRLLDRALFPMLRNMHTPIPPESIWGMKKNYSEKLAKTVRVKTVTMNSRRSLALDAANAIGLAPMLRSESFRLFAEKVVGRTLRADHWGRQVICYGAGDYSGPHNDHHPESEAAREGFIDLHIMFSNEAVGAQYLVYEEHGFLSRAEDVSCASAVAVYRLPFWHYTTPLIAKKGKEAAARRWLLLGSFDFAE
jgi:hypothetical protein